MLLLLAATSEEFITRWWFFVPYSLEDPSSQLLRPQEHSLQFNGVAHTDTLALNLCIYCTCGRSRHSLLLHLAEPANPSSQRAVGMRQVPRQTIRRIHGDSTWVWKTGWDREWVMEEITIVEKLFLYVTCHNKEYTFVLVTGIHYCDSNIAFIHCWTLKLLALYRPGAITAINVVYIKWKYFQKLYKRYSRIQRKQMKLYYLGLYRFPLSGIIQQRFHKVSSIQHHRSSLAIRLT
jgi:hypothetical protein